MMRKEIVNMNLWCVSFFQINLFFLDTGITMGAKIRKVYK
jgi:hypothetical protein